MNFTGYEQVVEEITRDVATQNVTNAKLFTLGHDVIDQTTFTPESLQAGGAFTLMYDGHGSTRALLDAAAEFVQHYAYTASGMAIGFDEAQALTALLYSGEAFDSRIDMQYLRARWYDPNTGRFNRLDSFSGNLHDPQSFHKYLYTHGDPVNGIDPTGLEANLGSLIGALGVVSNLIAFAFDQHAAIQAASEEKMGIAVAYQTLAVFDAVMLFVPFSGGMSMGARGMGVVLVGGRTIEVTTTGVAWLNRIAAAARPLGAVARNGRYVAGNVATLGLRAGIIYSEGVDTSGAGSEGSQIGDPNVGSDSHYGIDLGSLQPTQTVARQAAQRPYINSPNTIRNIIESALPVPDPGGVPGALRWDVVGSFRGSNGIYELVIDPAKNHILHFLFRST